MPAKRYARPEQVKLGIYTWKIEYDTKKMTEHTRSTGGCTPFGWTFPADQVILVEEDRPEDFTKDTVLHEFLHALLFSHHIAVPFSMEEKDQCDREEFLVRDLSPAILQAMRENPDFFGWLGQDGL